MTTLQYTAEITVAPAYGLNPSGIILRGTNALGNGNLGFIADGSETRRLFDEAMQHARFCTPKGKTLEEAITDVINSFIP